MLLSSTILAACVACSLFQVYHASTVTVGAPLPLQTNQVNMQTVKVRSVFLLNGGDIPDGLFYGIRAVFWDDVTRVTFQVWRPAVNATVPNQYRLVALYPPFSSQGRLFTEQSIYLNNFLLWNGNANSDLQLSCFNVMAGDKIGIYFENTAATNLGTIPYVFSTGGLVQTYITLASSSNNYTDEFTMNDIATFDTGVFPWQFQIAAAIETDPTAPCNTLVMPGDQPVTQVQMTTPPVTGPPGPPGATGATGPAGPIGSEGSAGDQGPPGPIGATGEQGSPGPIGPPGPVGATGYGETGDQGPVGPPGSMGAIGNTGPQGVEGPIGPPGPDGQLLETGASTGTLNNDNIVQGLLIWLAILSFIVLVILISIIALFCCYCGRQRQRKRERDEAAKTPLVDSRDGGAAQRGYPNSAYTDDSIPAKQGGRPLSTFSQGPSSQASGQQQPRHNGGGAGDTWEGDRDGAYVNTMRGEEEQDFENENIRRDPSYKGSRPIGLSRPLTSNSEDIAY